MHSTKLANTLYTADNTRYTTENTRYTADLISDHTRYSGDTRIHPPNTQYIPGSMSNFPAGYPLGYQPVYPGTYSGGGLAQQYPQQPHFSAQDQILTYCPVCRREYSNYQIQQHVAAHDSTNSYRFETNDPRIRPVNTQHMSTGHVYPLVEPLEFYTNELSDSVKSDQFILHERKNYDGVDPSYFRPERPVEAPVGAPAAQIVSRPPLQYQSDRTNMFNCLDNMVNSGKGPKFSASDIVGKNQFVTPKRQLTDWQLSQKRHK